MTDQKPNLPDLEAFISRAERTGSDLLIRFVTEYHPGANAQAYAIEIGEATDPEGAMAFLECCRADEDYVYVFQRDGHLVLQKENGEELEIAAATIRSKAVEFEAGEIGQIADRVYQWYTAEHAALRAAHARIENARSLLAESARRVQIKAAGYAEGGTAATLYKQQLALIRRVLGMLES